MGFPEDIERLMETAKGLDPAHLAELIDFAGYLRLKEQQRAMPSVLADAPVDDEPTTERDRAAIREALSDPDVMSAEDIKKRCGLA